MQAKRWISALTLLLAVASFSLADGVPPDGAVALRSGGKSDPILNSTQTIFFSSCAGAQGDLAFDCGLFAGGAQAVFAGFNATGEASNFLTLILTIPPLSVADGPESIGCDGGTLFTINNCANIVVNPSPNTQTVTLNFQQGTGMGLGCYDNSGAYYNQWCSNTNANVPPGGIYQSGWQTSGTTCSNPFKIPNLVCGPNEFVIGIGAGNPFPADSIPTTAILIIAPEPSTVLMVIGALIIMAYLGVMRTRRIGLAT